MAGTLHGKPGHAADEEHLMSLTNHGEDKLLTLFKDAGPYYFGLFTVAPEETGGGTEVSGGAYARQQVTFGDPSSGTMKNSAAIEFPTATGSWGTAVAWGLAGDIYRIATGNLTLTMD